MATSEPEGDNGRPMDTTENPDSYSGLFRINLERHRVFVEGRMDPNHGLVDRLQETDAIDYNQVQIICAEKVPFMKSRKILDFILEGNSSEYIKKFCQALRDTKQQHLVNYVEANGVYVAQFVGNWPLGEREIKIIDKNGTFLKQKLDTAGGLLADMRKHSTITQWQEECVSEHTRRLDRNTALLEIIRRGSLSEYKNTIDRLVETKQEHIAAVLREGGTVVQVHSRAAGEVPTIKEGEAEIVAQLLNVMPQKTLQEQAHLLELAQLKILGLIDAVVIKSIGLFFHCKDLSDFDCLVDLLKNKELQRIVEAIYNKFISTSTKIKVTLTWSVDEFNRVKRDLQEMESTYPESPVAPVAEATESEFNIPSPVQAGSSQPAEVETELPQPGSSKTSHAFEKSLLQSAGSSQPSHSFEKSFLQSEEPDPLAAALMDTDIQKLRQSKGFRPELREDEIIPAIIRNNMDYFTEHIQPRLLINKLHGLGIIRDERMRHLRSMSYDNEKNYEVLNIIRAASIENYHRFVQCLRETDQSLVAEVAEKGGVVLKVKVTHEPTENPEEAQKEIVEKLKQLQDKRVPKSEDVWRFLSQLKRANMEIVSARWDKGVVMWFWCRSEQALVTLECLNMTEFEESSKKSSQESTSRKPECQRFGLMLNGLFTLLLSEKRAPTISSVFLDNPDKDVVCQKPSKDFPQEKDTKIDVGERNVLSAAKLENKIYVLCQNPTAVLVFEEGDLTEPKQELPVEGIIAPVDIASSNESNCLYVTARGRGRASVWKIAISSPENKVDIWFEGGACDPFTLSVTNDGRVVMVKGGSPSSLDIYDPDALLLLHLILPTHILIPNHAVETSKGNLVVSYSSNVGFPGGVCEITKEGEIISRFDSMFESISGLTQNMNALLANIARKSFDFHYLAIDHKDQVYACSDETDGLMRLDSRLNLETIVRRDELKGPLRVHYVKQGNQLMVIDRQHMNLVFILNAK